MSGKTRAPSILFIDQSGEMGGAEHSLFDIANHYRGHAGVILLANGPFHNRLLDAGIQVDVLPIGRAGSLERTSGILASLRAIPEIAKVAWQLSRKARTYDVVYANTQKAFVIGAFASILARRPLIWHLRDILTADHFSSNMKKVVVTLANWLADCVIANSQATADAFRSAGGTEKVWVVHNGIDPSAFDAVDHTVSRQSLRKELCADEATQFVGVFSRLAQWKGQHVLIEAISTLPSVHAVFVGGPLFSEESYELMIKNQAKELGVDKRCHFLGFRSDIPALMAGMDIIAHTSITPEPFGRVVVEGMLSGNPVIASDSGGVIEIITSNETGILTPPGNSGALREAIYRLISDRQFAKQIAAHGNTSAREKFSLNVCLSRIDEIVLSTLKLPTITSKNNN